MSNRTKYYLSVSQRKIIINDLLVQQRQLNDEIKAKNPPAKIVEMAEETNQERRELTELFKVGENEE
jgi:hypothetical protein